MSCLSWSVIVSGIRSHWKPSAYLPGSLQWTAAELSSGQAVNFCSNSGSLWSGGQSCGGKVRFSWRWQSPFCCFHIHPALDCRWWSLQMWSHTAGCTWECSPTGRICCCPCSQHYKSHRLKLFYQSFDLATRKMKSQTAPHSLVLSFTL